MEIWPPEVGVNGWHELCIGFTMAESIEARQENWLRVVWGLLYMREGLQEYVDTKGKQQYQVFRNNVMGKSGHFCDEMKREVQNNHKSKNPIWVNTDSTKWEDPHVGHWEVTKCYLSTSGYLDKTEPNHVDASGLLSICINSSFIKKLISNIQHFEELRNIRNKALHDAHYEFDRQTADDCLDKMIAVLEDPQELLHNASAKKAADNIRKCFPQISKKCPESLLENCMENFWTLFIFSANTLETCGNSMERRKNMMLDLSSFLTANLLRIDRTVESLQKFHGISTSFRTFSAMVFQEDLWKSVRILQIFRSREKFSMKCQGRQIKERSAKIPVFMSNALEQWLHKNFDVESALKETEERMFERLRKELKEELTHHIHEGYTDRALSLTTFMKSSSTNFIAEDRGCLTYYVAEESEYIKDVVTGPTDNYSAD
ncbi:hypothetical protein MAR_003141, partial [Mya arenaria]